MRPAAGLPPPFPATSGSRPARVQSFPNLSSITQANSPPAATNLNPSPSLPPSSSLFPSPHPTTAFSFLSSQPRAPITSPSPVQHVPQPRFHSFEHNGAEDEEEEKPSSPQMMPAAAAGSTSPLLASQPQRSPEASPPSSSSSLSPQRSRSPGTLSFSEKRKLGKEAAKEAAVGGDTAGGDLQPQPAPQQAHGTSRWHSWRRLLRQCWSGLLSWHESKAFWLCLYSVALLLTSVGNSIYFKKMINKMENYVYFLNQFTTVMSAHTRSQTAASTRDDPLLTAAAVWLFCLLSPALCSASLLSSSLPSGISFSSPTASLTRCTARSRHR